jgi:hypothetical protein
MQRPRSLPALLLLALAAAAPVHAQRNRATLVLHVADAEGRPLTRASVRVGGFDYGALTDGEGNARLPGIPEGNRLIEVRRVGFQFTRTAADFVPGDTVRREVRLTPAPVELEGITVTSWGRSMALRRSGFYERQRRGFGAFITSDRIDELHPIRTNELFRYMRGFMIKPTQGGHEAVVATRGEGLHGDCLASVYVDGMQMFMRDVADQEMAINMIPPEDIAGIEAFAGAASIPAEYNATGNACGVVLIWTHR